MNILEKLFIVLLAVCCYVVLTHKPLPNKKRIYHKTVEVEIMKIQENYFKTERFFNINVKSVEYNLETTVRVDRFSNNKMYYDLINRNIKVGNKYQILMYSIVDTKTNKIIKRYLDNIFIE